MAAVKELKSSRVADLKPLKYQEDDSSYYRVVFQLGVRRAWKNFKPGDVKVDVREGHDGRKQRDLEFVPRVHEVGPVDLDTVNGMIATHNKWLAANQSREKEGLIQRMFAVLGVTKTQEIPESKSNITLAKAMLKFAEALEKQAQLQGREK